MLNILFIGDIVGENGLDLAMDLLPRIRNDFSIEFTVANGENVNRGKGLTARQAKRLTDCGVNAITTGNHIWDAKTNNELFTTNDNVLRPHNYPQNNPGTGIKTFRTENGVIIKVLNLQGRSFMFPLDCPFQTADKLLLAEDVRCISLVDFHAESSAEKQALGWHLDGSVSAVVGTHTHVQTADEKILPKGTGYITDAGMTGPFNSVIGMDREVALKRFISQTNFYYKLAEGDLRLNGLVLGINEKSCKTESIKRLNFSKQEYNGR